MSKLRKNIMFMKKTCITIFLSEAQYEFSLAMHTEYEFLIHNKVHNYKLEPELRLELKTTELNVMKSLKHHIGFDIGLLELMFAPKGSELEKLLTNAEKNCYCPVHKKTHDACKQNLNKQIQLSVEIDTLMAQSLKLMEIVNENQKRVNDIKEEQEQLQCQKMSL